ncbi:gem-associated protein 2 [Octopus bimaculoides]|uniref:Gem-associated protein 2 n=1 Tax=Octopus bimaculoides TaxID=37653 RepID=A0A0L8GI61_OCTBM|nr:gem-associated protein 2 [Octopus bimaculoides]|eukprot:XP_014780798.1 PREDICTED: gem-associated protein 2-like [Octopus bimaculoides]
MEEVFTPAIPVDTTLDNNYDLNIPPMTGNEYLRRVRDEALCCPSVVVAKSLNTEAMNRKQNVHILAEDCCLPAPTGLEPSAEWKRKQVADFAKIRQKLNKYKSTHESDIKIMRRKLPLASEVEEWFKLCFGRLKNLTPDESNVLEGGCFPFLSLVSVMEQHCIEQLLNYHMNCFESIGFTHHQGQWIFALLTCLQKPLTPEACSAIRNLARICARLRALMNSTTDPHLTPLNLIICLVCQYFEQKDLISS